MESPDGMALIDQNGGRGKRKHKEVELFQPTDYLATPFETETLLSQMETEPGRGTKLQDLDICKSCLVNAPSNPNIITAYKFLFGKKYGLSPQIQTMKTRLLEFSGYLPPLNLVENYDDEKQDSIDEKLEKKYSGKAFTLHYDQVRMLCDTFGVNRTSEDGKNLTKDTLVDRLLDFLSCPDASMVKIMRAKPSSSKPSSSSGAGSSRGSNKKVTDATVSSKKRKGDSTPKTKKHQKVAEEQSSDKDTDPFDLIRNHKKGDDPSDDALRQWVRSYLVCFDTESVTTKDAIRTASAKFGIDLSTKKSLIKGMISEELEE